MGSFTTLLVAHGREHVVIVRSRLLHSLKLVTRDQNADIAIFKLFAIIRLYMALLETQGRTITTTFEFGPDTIGRWADIVTEVFPSFRDRPEMAQLPPALQLPEGKGEPTTDLSSYSDFADRMRSWEKIIRICGIASDRRAEYFDPLLPEIVLSMTQPFFSVNGDLKAQNEIYFPVNNLPVKDYIERVVPAFARLGFTPRIHRPTFEDMNVPNHVSVDFMKRF